MHEIKDLFVDFLLENNCYSQAQTNFMEQLHITIEEYVESFDNEYIELLNYSFSWIDSPEGYGYWNNIDDLWREKLEEE